MLHVNNNRYWIVVFLCVQFGFSPALLAKEQFIYQQGVNHVKVSHMPKKEREGLVVEHPTVFTVDQMTDMLLSLKIARRHLVKKDVDDQQLFSPDEAARFAPYLVQAFERVEAEEWVSLTVVHKRPLVVIRNDRLTLGHLWVSGGKLVIRFDKVYAKLSGDYEASSNHNRQLNEATSVRLSLESGPGQTLSANDSHEIALDIAFDYRGAAQALAQSPPPPQGAVPPPPPRPIAPTAASRPIKERLAELEGLKKDGLVTEQEYADMRTAILGNL